jgi:soluble lytic murein transglycosylase-like protein/TolA-binding protein
MLWAAECLVLALSLSAPAVADPTPSTTASPTASDTTSETASPTPSMDGVPSAPTVAAPEAPPAETEPPIAAAKAVAPPTVGTVLAQAPSVAPGRVPPKPKNALKLANERYNQGDLTGTVSALSPWLNSRQSPHGRTRSAGHLLLATAHMELGDWNLASRHFYRVRRSGGPLAPYGAWLEAEVDHERGRHLVAVKECRAYREKWPEGPHADECLLLMGDAYAASGHRGSAIGSYNKYLEKHPDTPRGEELRLATAQAWASTDPRRGIQLLHELALSHSYPSTDLAVQAELGNLMAAGHAQALPIPSDPSSRMRRCASLRRSGRFGEAWALFQELARQAPDDPQIANWVKQNEERYAWGTRRYDVYAEALQEEYAASPTADRAWQIFRAWGRDGEWAKAAEWGRKGLDVHKGDWRWRKAKDDVAWAALLAAQNTDAAERWSKLSKGGGEFGRKALFYAGLSRLLAEDYAGAKADFDKLLKSPRGWDATAYYWRAKAQTGLGDTDAAEADRAAARAHDDSGWYTELLRPTAASGADPDWRHRDGRWHGEAPLASPSWTRPNAVVMSQPGLWPAALPLHRQEDGTTRAALTAEPAGPPMAVRWDAHKRASTTDTNHALAATDAPDVPRAGLALPDGYVECRFWDEAEAAKALSHFADAHVDIWPHLPAAYDLARAGLYTDAARLMFDAYGEWRDVLSSGPGDDPRRASIAAIGARLSDWRPFLLYTRDHYNAARACSGLDKLEADPVAKDIARRLSYPVVRPREIWTYGQRYDVDPFLVMGLMRQESTYRNTALSPVGAIGLVQVMPRTGARVAAMLGEHRYSPRDLEDPQVNLRYGVYYLSRLLDRFDGNYPMAIASYNGGPHNVSRWYKPRRDNVPTDVFVELIQYDETRDYVKKVTGHYARYIATYEGPEARVVIPPRPIGDDASVIDF